MFPVVKLPKLYCALALVFVVVNVILEALFCPLGETPKLETTEQSVLTQLPLEKSSELLNKFVDSSSKSQLPQPLSGTTS